MVMFRHIRSAASALFLLLVFSTFGEAVDMVSSLEDRSIGLHVRDDCQTNLNWQATQSAWLADDTDSNLASWWQNVSSRSNQGFAHELGERFGAHLNGFECGIDAQSTCTAPACADYQNHGDPAWAYLSLLAVVNLNTFFNRLHEGITTGQTDYNDLTPSMAEIFFPWKTPQFIFGDAAFWVVASLTALFGIPMAVESLGAEAIAAAAGIGAFAGAGVQQVSLSLQPEVGKAGYFRGTSGFGISSENRDMGECYFDGQPDSENKTILDYLHGGVFAALNSVPSSYAIEQFYKAQLVSRTIGTQWATQKVFLMFFKTENPDDASGPAGTRYYSAQDGGVYYLYRYSEDGVLRGHLDKPWGLDDLNSTTYGINGADITKASARAYRVAGFNYSQAITQERLTASLASNNTLTPFTDGASWEGTWSLPVCDTGSNNWNMQYGKTASRYGMLPCCCGPNCNETATFVKTANMLGFQTLLRGCQAQLANTNISYSSVDYGFKWKNSLPLAWATWSTAKKAGIAVGIIFASFIPLLFCGCCLAAIDG